MQQPMIAPARQPFAPMFWSSRPYIRIKTTVARANLKARNTNTEESAKASLTKTNVAPQIRVQRISRRSALSFRDTRAGVGSTGGRIQPRYLQQDQQHALHPNLAARRV